MKDIENSLSAALAAAQDGPAFVAALPNSAALEFSGADARSFLHGQLANDVSGLAVGAVGRSLLLNHKGHAMAEAAVVRTAEAVLLVVDDDRLAWVSETLERHIVFDDVKIARPAAAVLTLQGTLAAALLAAAGLAVPEAGQLAETRLEDGALALVYEGRRSAGGGYDLLLIDGQAQALMARLVEAGAVQVASEALAAARVEARIPSAGGEGGDGVLPQEAGLDLLISYRKGCYLGQEIMARIEARGSVRREPALLELEDLPTGSSPRNPEVGGQPSDSVDQRAILLGGRKVGVLGTVATMPDGNVRALGVIRRDVADTEELSVGGVRGRRLTPSAPIMPV